MYEPSSVSEMQFSGNNKNENFALMVNDNYKNTIESNYNNINTNINNNISNDINIEFKEKTLKKSKNIEKKKLKFLPLKEKKWKKLHSVEKLKQKATIEEDNFKYNNNIKLKNSNDNRNKKIYINKQSNLYINKNYNLFGDYKKNSVLNKFIKKNRNQSKDKNQIKINFDRNYNFKGHKTSKSQEKYFNNSDNSIYDDDEN